MARRNAPARPALRLVEEPPSRHAMPSTWRDPDDVTPGARRTPRTITGWRHFDPLRRMLLHPNSGLTAQHVQAADVLRECVDIATLGYSGTRPMIFVAQSHLPRTGMGPAALAMTRAQRVVRRVVKLFTPGELLLLQTVVLGNVSVREWTRHQDPPSSQLVEKRRLLLILDKLAEHFASDIEDDVARGRRLPL